MCNTGNADTLDVNAAGAAFVIVDNTFLYVLHRRLTLTLTLCESLTLFGPVQLTEQRSDVSAAKRVHQGGLSDAAVAE